jgi:glutaredoxin
MENLPDTVPHIILYSKPGCHLCDDARAILDELAVTSDQLVPFVLDEIDIRSDDTLFATYRYRIPVITIDGNEIAEGNLDTAAIALLNHALART